MTANPVPLPREVESVAGQVVPVSFSIARILLMGTLLAAPLAFGAVESWAWAALAVVAALLLLLWAAGNVQQQRLKVFWQPLYFPAALFLLLGFVQYTAQLSLDSYATRESLIKLATDLVFFFLAGQLLAAEPAKTWKRIGLVVTLYAFAMSLFATIQFFSSHGLIYWRVKTHGWIFGSYVNHNDYAGLLEMLIPIAAVYVLSQPEKRGARRLLAFGVLISICSVLLSGSRGGSIAILIECLVLGAVFSKRAGRAWQKSLAAMMILGLGAVALLFFWLAPARLSRRLETSASLTDSPEVTLGERWVVWKDSFKIVRDHLLRGIGLGSYEAVFPQYQSFASDRVWDHAHNDYVEALAECGVAGGLLMLAAVGIFFHSAFGNLRERLQSASGAIQLGAGIGCCGLLVHSLSDFNLHIPANAAWFAFCLGTSTLWIGGGKCRRGE